MNRKHPKAMHLSRDTVRQLTPRDLDPVAGGFSLPPTQCGASNETCDPCRTYSCGLYRCL